ncbi:MAG: ribonuclease D [Gammaproteobacteria bacterium]|nr:ribonuclease D [Gammaproteobacteria bacterium]
MTTPHSVSPHWVCDTASLQAMLGAMADAPWLALDTEFMRERTYYPRLCLIQLATDRASAVIDPLAVADLAPLAEFLGRPGLTKIVHAARQDLEALQCAGIRLAGPLFDTQLAAALVGHPDQVSYAWLVEHYCGVALDKSQTRTDWSQRPLSDAQILYAEEDVKHLGRLHQQLQQALLEQGKLDWLWEETNPLLTLAAEGDAPEDAWRRVKALSAQPGEVAATARVLAEWREKEARAADIPRGWLLKDDVLLEMARRLPENVAALARIPGIPAPTVRRHTDALLAILASPRTPLPASPSAWRLTKAGQKVLGELQDYIRQQGEALKVSPTVLATRRDLEQLLLEGMPARLRNGWRAAVVGSGVEKATANLDRESLRQSAQG